MHSACYINCILHMIAPVKSHSGKRGHNPLPFIRADLICPYRTHDREFRTVLRSAHFRSGRRDARSSPNHQQRTETDVLKPLALTGGIASGKSTAARFLLEAGFSHVYDTDAICHELYEEPTPELSDGLRKLWGDDVVSPGGAIDRPVLSGRLFGAADRAAAFAALNAIVHPAVEKRLREYLDRDAEDDGLALVEVPLLFEIGWDRKFLRTIAVWTPRELQIARLMARGGMSREDAETRLSVQMSGDARLAKADFGLINNGSPEHLRKQCFALTALLKTLPL